MNSQDSGQKFLFKLLLSVLLYTLLVPLGLLVGGDLLVREIFREPFIFILVFPLQILLGFLFLFIHLIFAFRISVEYLSSENKMKAWVVTAIVFFVDILVTFFLLYWSGYLGKLFGFGW